MNFTFYDNKGNVLHSTKVRLIENPKDLQLEIKESQHLSSMGFTGLGLYTTAAIQKGQKICQYNGEEISYKEMKNRYGKWTAPYVYRRMPWQTQIDGAGERCCAAYANDGVWKYNRKEDRFEKAKISKCNASFPIGCKRWMIAQRDIASGEEILIDYGKQYWDNYLTTGLGLRNNVTGS